MRACLTNNVYTLFPVQFIGSFHFVNRLKVVRYMFVRTFGQSGLFSVGTTPGGQDVVPAVNILDNYLVNIDGYYPDLYINFSGSNRILVYIAVLNLV